MSPSFSSPRQAGGFALLLAIILLLPFVMRPALLPPREAVYAATPDRLGPYPFLERQIFQEKEPIDIAFLGSSHIWNGVDTPYVQQELSKKLGRKTVALTLGWAYPGFDAVYFVLRDLLQNRKVKMLVIYDECRGSGMPHVAASRWFRLGDHAGELAGLPFSTRAGFYAEAVRGMPRNLLSLLRRDLPVNSAPGKPSFWESFYHAENSAFRLGSLAVHLGYGNNPVFEEFTPRTGARASDVFAYGPQTAAQFEFGDRNAPLSQDFFARKIVELARKHGTKVMVLHLPETTEMRSSVVQERVFWREKLADQVTFVGIPPAKLFEGLRDEDVFKLFYDSGHLNQNGQRYFTKLITPCLLETYAPIQN